MPRRKRPKVNVTLSMFDTRDPIYRPVRTAVALDDFRPITTGDYKPCGGTPLRDAVGRFIGHLSDLRTDSTVTVGLLLDESGSMGGRENEVVESVNQFVEGLRAVDAVDPDAAGTILCVIVTDGYENASRETSHEQLRKLVRRSEKDGFTMIFLGSAIDAWAQGSDIGLSGSSSGQMVSYSGAKGSTSSAMLSVTCDAQQYLGNQSQYATARATGAMRSVADDGTEVLSNINEGAK